MNRRLWTLLASVVLSIGLLHSPMAGAKALAQAQDSTGIRVVLHDTDCMMTTSITNLPKYAEWLEGSKKVKGCWAVDSNLGMVIIYFADKTVVVLPAQIFEAVTEV